MNIDGIKVMLIGQLVRRKDGLLVTRDRWNERALLSPHADPEAWGVDGHPVGKQPEYGAVHYKAWMLELQEWERRVSASPAYAQQADAIIRDQESEPLWYAKDGSERRCVFKGKIYSVDGDSIGGMEAEDCSLVVKHFVLSQQQKFKSLEREIRAFENFDHLVHRDPIPESVRLYVWQRDQGKCVECGRRDGLEFDHIIPVSEGGNSTERNVQLLCLRCNRSKGAKV